MLRSRFYGYFSIYNIALAGTGTSTDKGNVYSISGVPGYYNWTALSTGIDGGVNALAIKKNIVFAGGSSLWVLNSNLKYLDVLDSIGVMSAAGDTATFKIITNDSWFILCYNDWITFSPSEGKGDATITVTATPNNTNNMRLGIMSINGEMESVVYFYQSPAYTTGIYNSSSTNITIYPVPVKDDLVISFPSQSNNTRFAIYNLSGMELLASPPTGNTTKVKHEWV
ncbi:MAG: BACON domain-containing protein [Draconibacterium sp.]|nr:BACON domain-containing protein [Draconibacterium sp.]